MKKHIFIIAILAILGLGFYIYKQTTYTYVTAKFQELRPFHHKLPVYYKGIIVGKATGRKHSDDFKHTYVRMVLYPKNLLLPKNTEVLLKKEKRNKEKERDFLELIYPKEPSSVMVSDGSILEGKATVDVDTFMDNQHPDDIAQIKENLMNASQNLDNATMALADLLVLLQDVIKENERNLNTISGNLARTTSNLNQITGKVDTSLEQKKLENTLSGLDNSVQNLQVITQNLSGTTDSVNTIMPSVDSVLYQTQSLVCNANAISCGVRKTLSKRFGGLRILFGKTINSNNSGSCK